MRFQEYTTLLLIAQVAANDWKPLWQLLHGNHGNSWDSGKLAPERLRSFRNYQPDAPKTSKISPLKPGDVVRDNFGLTQ